ncbi:hypothetical protein [Halobacterium salinarum]|uniref:hypothetical protein n=1 Tax=Halobacterium salinarum TaxID=2242 RepID=UPI00255516D4|nr:hypothetical protein [Halobacterium salinarum]MDL0145479.1 hypothetical protein [Halobacterium salinarum]
MPSEKIRNFNDGISAYENIFHSAGNHPQPIHNPSRREIEDRIEQIDKTKREIHDPQRIQRLNRLRNYLLEANYEIQ